MLVGATMNALTLVLVHVIFRHGQRTPQKDHMFPSDPYLNYDYYPVGYGQLTNKGKLTCYKLGLQLRQRYDEFLGDTYTPGIVDPWSSDYDRTKATLQLVLASLFPPKRGQVWNKDLLWNPIPYKYDRTPNDRFFIRGLVNDAAVSTYNEYLNGPGQEVLKKHENIILDVEEKSGLKIKSPKELLAVYSTLDVEKEMGFELPSWADMMSSKDVEKVMLEQYNFLSATTKLKAYTVGKLLEKIVDDTYTKIAGTSDFKIHLYSGHEHNIAVVMKCLDVFYQHMPHYGAYFLLELHKIDDVYGFKIFYQSEIDGEMRQLEMPGCGPFCPVKKFVGFIQYILDETTEIDLTS